MCGIVGIARLGERPLPDAFVLRRMMSTIQYRGPDDSGEFLSDDVQLGVVRLSIQDPKNGAQPVFSCSGESVAVYNGEVYNAHALRQRLLRDGHRIGSQCDSELLPHLYEEHGIEMVNELRGMFAFSIWDNREKRLFFARDRMGIKPLYYARMNDFLLFASEVKAIIASGMIDPEIDLDSLDDLFSMSYPCPPRTMFKEILEIPPAHILNVRTQTREVAKVRYWESPTPPAGSHSRISRAEAAEELRSLLRLRVYDHTMADSPVAAYLSGGLDSSAICGLMKEVYGDPPETFTVSFESAAYDEYPNALEVVEFLDSPNHVLHCGARMAEDLERMVWHTELPLQFSLALPMIALAGLAKTNGYPVVLSGDGADELMGGYDCFRGDKMRRMLDRPGLRFLRPLVYRQLYKWLQMPEGAVDGIIENQLSARQIQQNYGGIIPPWYDVWTTVGVDRQRLLGFSGRLIRDVREAPVGFSDLLPSDIGRMHPLDAGIALEQRTRLPAWILLIGDRASMAEGVEARVPFLDQDVVEFMASMPPSFKMQGLQEKAILRQCTSSLMPKSTNIRQKRPFFTPIREWFFSESEPEFVRDELSPERLRATGLFDPGLVAAYRREIRVVPERSLMRNRLEWTLFLILQTQIMQRLFVEARCLKSPLPPMAI